MFTEMAGDEPYVSADDAFECFVACIHHIRIEDSLPNRVSTFLTIPCHRYGHSVYVNVLRNDDVEPNVGVTSF